MFVAIARFPTIPTEREEGFQAWFAWSNDQLREIDGLKGRRLLRAPDGTYMALVEHKTSETFDAMHATEAASRAHARLGDVIIDEPRVTKYDVVVDFAKADRCNCARPTHLKSAQVLGRDRRTASSPGCAAQVSLLPTLVRNRRSLELSLIHISEPTRLG